MSVPVEADKVVVSENVLTMSDRDDSGPSFAAFKNGRICAVGPVSGLSSWEGSGTEIIDVGDRLVLPGFIDTHCHLEKHARTTYKSVDVRAPRCASIAHVTKELERSIPDSLLDGWIVAQGNLFFDQKLADQRLPTRDDLDRASKDVPIMIRAGGHVSILNTAALERAGFDKSYTPPDDGGHGKAELLLDEKGQPNGVIKEMDDLVPFPRASGANLKQAIRHAAGESFTRFGVTSICQLSETVEGLQLMDELIRGQDIGLRIASFITVPATMTLDDACSWQDHLEVSAPPDWFEIKGVKIFTDGGYSAASAAVKSNYLSTKRNGEMGLTKEEIRAYYVRTQQAGLGLAVHTNGDRAQEIVCEAVLMDEGPLGGVPVRLEHAGNFLPDYTTVDLWRRAGARPVPQPVFLYAFGDFFPVYLGDYGANGRFPFRRLIDDGWELPGSSDVSIGARLCEKSGSARLWMSMQRSC